MGRSGLGRQAGREERLGDRASATNHQEVYQVALNGQTEGSTAVLRAVQGDGNPRPEPWSRTRSSSSAFTRTAAISGTGTCPGPCRSPTAGGRVGINDNPSFADWVYFVVEHPPKPTTFKAVIGWERRRSGDRSNFEGW